MPVQNEDNRPQVIKTVQWIQHFYSCYPFKKINKSLTLLLDTLLCHLVSGTNILSNYFKRKNMIQPKEKIGSNIQHNFNNSAEINAWSKKYNTPIDEIQKIFTENGNSISKTLEILRQKEQVA